RTHAERAAEAKCRGPRPPWNRHAAAVAPVLGAAGSSPDRVLTNLVRQVKHLGQAEPLTLVQVARTGEGERERRRGARLAKALSHVDVDACPHGTADRVRRTGGAVGADQAVAGDGAMH